MAKPKRLFEVCKNSNQNSGIQSENGLRKEGYSLKRGGLKMVTILTRL
jgi:hypothetical protein